VLLEAGADPNAKNYIGESPLKLAANSLQVSMSRLLLDSGADPNIDDGVPGIVGEPLIIRLVAKVSQRPKAEELDKLIEIVGLLLDHGANINARSQDDVPMVGLALPEVKMLHFLVDRGAITDISWDGVDLKEIIPKLLEPNRR